MRNSARKDAVVYFGPMGCQTGFYFLFDERRLSVEGAVGLVKEVFEAAEGVEEMPGKSAAECGNYANLDLETGKSVCRYYSGVVRGWTAGRLAYE